MDNLNLEQRKRNMRAIKSSNCSSTEKLFRIFLKKFHITGWRANLSKAFGKPDFSFSQKKLVIFIDGCFWHGCPFHYKSPTSNIDYWNNKVQKNKNRDIEVNNYYREKGWRVVRILEHEVKSDLEKYLDILR